MHGELAESQQLVQAERKQKMDLIVSNRTKEAQLRAAIQGYEVRLWLTYFVVIDRCTGLEIYYQGNKRQRSSTGEIIQRTKKTDVHILLLCKN